MELELIRERLDMAGLLDGVIDRPYSKIYSVEYPYFTVIFTPEQMLLELNLNLQHALPETFLLDRRIKIEDIWRLYRIRQVFKDLEVLVQTLEKEFIVDGADCVVMGDVIMDEPFVMDLSNLADEEIEVEEVVSDSILPEAQWGEYYATTEVDMIVEKSDAGSGW